MNDKDTPFDHNLVEELGYESAMPYLEGKYGEGTRVEYERLILGKEIRITLLHYKNKVISKFSPYYIPTKSENEGLRVISHPPISKEELEKLKNGTLEEANRILNNLTSI